MRHITPLAVRMPSELKERLEQAAVAGRRSLNSEMVARLESSFQRPLQAVPTSELIAELVERGKVEGIVVSVENAPTS